MRTAMISGPIRMGHEADQTDRAPWPTICSRNSRPPNESLTSQDNGIDVVSGGRGARRSPASKVPTAGGRVTKRANWTAARDGWATEFDLWHLCRNRVAAPRTLHAGATNSPVQAPRESERLGSPGGPGC